MGKNNAATLPKWWQQCEPIKFFLVALPGIRESEKRWALFQVILSLVFFCIALAVGFFTVNLSEVSGGVMITAFILFGLGMLGLVYAIAIGVYWYSSNSAIKPDAKRDEQYGETLKAIKQLLEYLKREQDK